MAEIKLEFEVPIYIEGKKTTLLGLNFYRNAHYHVNNKVKINFERLIAEKIKDKINETYFKEYMIHYELYYKNSQCDLMNVVSVIDKFVQDSLQELGIVENDNVKYCKEVVASVGGQDKENPRVRVIITNIL